MKTRLGCSLLGSLVAAAHVLTTSTTVVEAVATGTRTNKGAVKGVRRSDHSLERYLYDQVQLDAQALDADERVGAFGVPEKDVGGASSSTATATETTPTTTITTIGAATYVTTTTTTTATTTTATTETNTTSVAPTNATLATTTTNQTAAVTNTSKTTNETAAPANTTSAPTSVATPPTIATSPPTNTAATATSPPTPAATTATSTKAPVGNSVPANQDATGVVVEAAMGDAATSEAPVETSVSAAENTSPPAPKVLSATEKANQAGSNIIKGTKNNLAQGRKGSKKGGSKKGVKRDSSSSSSDQGMYSLEDCSRDGETQAASGKGKKKSRPSPFIKGEKSRTGAYGRKGGGKGGKKKGYGASADREAWCAENAGVVDVSPAQETVSSPVPASGTQESSETSPVPASGTPEGSPGTSPVPASASATPAPAPQLESGIAAPGSTDQTQPQPAAQAMIDCDAIRSGTATTNTPSQVTYVVKADYIIENTYPFTVVAGDAQNFLQQNVATAMTGCPIPNRRWKQRARHARRKRQRRQLQFMPGQDYLYNVEFLELEQDPEADPATTPEGGGATRYPTAELVNMYFDGVAVDLKSRLSDLLKAADFSVIPGVLRVENIRVEDPSETSNLNNVPIGSGSTTEPGDSVNEISKATSSQIDDEAADQQWTDTVIGLAVGMGVLALLVLLICFFDCCPSPFRRDRDGTASGAKSLSSQAEPPSVVQNQTFDRESHSSHDSGEYPATEVKLEDYGRDNEQIRFLAADAEDEMEGLPADATRSYYDNDTVNL